jgi:hypothetical protein
LIHALPKRCWTELETCEEPSAYQEQLLEKSFEGATNFSCTQLGGSEQAYMYIIRKKRARNANKYEIT